MISVYSDIELTIHRQDQQKYTVDFRYSDSDPDNQTEVRLGAGQEVFATFDFDQLQEQVLLGDMQAYGRILTQSLFASEPLRVVFAQGRAAAEQAGVPLRIRLNIHSSAMELFSLYWETLLDPQSNICFSTDQNVYFSRYLASQDWRSVRLRARGELKALAFIAAPTGLSAYKLADVDKAKETETIQTGFEGISLTILEHATLDNLANALTENEFDILYIVAHGTFANKESYLWLENEKGEVSRTAGNELLARIRELEKRPRLAVLASCQSAGKGEGGVLSSLGPLLAEAGIPAVLAMQDNVLMDTVTKFMPIFFRELKDDGQIDRALSIARGQVRSQPDWWVPVLFMRMKSGRIWYVPGFGGPRGDFPKWPSLLRGVQTGRCTPILGPGLVDALIGSPLELVQAWAEELEFPLAPNDRDSLFQVAEYRVIDQSRFTAEDEWLSHLRAALRKRNQLPPELNAPNAPLSEMFKAAREQRAAVDEFEPHKILASLPIRIYITVNTNELLEAALIAAGKKPITMICPWREFGGNNSDNDDLDPTVEAPLVYHLLGVISQPETMVLTEDEVFELLTNFALHRNEIPEQVGRALSDSALLLIGFEITDWSFRALMKTLLNKEGNSLLRRHAHIAAQIEPDENHLINPTKARRYLESYFSRASNIDINVYWGTSHEFLKELASRLNK